MQTSEQAISLLWWGGKKNRCREIWMALTTPVHVSQRRVHIKDADLGSPLASAVRR